MPSVMSAKVILLLFALSCHHGTIKSQEQRKQEDCVYNNVTYKFGDTVDVGETCRRGYCYYDGEVKSIATCCLYKNKTYRLNSDFKPSPCKFGFCGYDGTASVVKGYCPEKNCSDKIKKSGECCPRCRGDPVPTCDYNGQTYNIDDTFQAETCVTGYCNGYGDVELIQTCCDYDGNTYDLNSDFNPTPCQYGYCTPDGEVEMAMASCEMRDCPAVYDEGVCCPRCPDGWKGYEYYDNKSS